MRDVAHAAPSRLLFQDGLQDEIVTRKQLENLYRAASKPKEIRWYAAGHLLDERAMHDQLAWLSRELDATGPAVPGARTGP
jgi:predicted esterase